MTVESQPISAPVEFKKLVADIERSLSDEDAGWCSLDKALTLASIVLAIRPAVVVELGVWTGGSAIPLGLALTAVGSGQLLAVDAWSAEASVDGQAAEEHAQWWGVKMGDAGHRRAFEMFLARLRRHGVHPDRCAVRRQRTDVATVPPSIDLLHHDANHGPQAVRDIERWAPAVRLGGMLVIDDLAWHGGHVSTARDRAVELGFEQRFLLGTGCVMQRVRIAP